MSLRILLHPDIMNKSKGRKGRSMTRDLLEALNAYIPWNEQEDRDRRIMLAALSALPDPFTRDNEIMHFTASSWIVNRDCTKVLMAYHNLYNAWAWTGGHADGDRTVDGHEKRGRYVSSHLHLNVTYLLQADESEEIRVKADENAAVRWFALSDALTNCSEPWMVKRVYSKLNQKLGSFVASLR